MRRDNAAESSARKKQKSKMGYLSVLCLRKMQCDERKKKNAVEISAEKEAIAKAKGYRDVLCLRDVQMR